MSSTQQTHATAEKQGTEFSAGECGIIEKAMEIAQVATQMTGLAAGDDIDGCIELVRLKAAAGALR
jgi:hypothetical protein